MDPVTLARLALLSAILAANGANGAAPPSIAPTAAPSANATYIVQSGDTLFSIALKYNTTIAALQQANQLADPNALAVGQRLIIPNASGAQNAVTPAPTARGPTPNASPPPNATPSAAPQNYETYIVRAGDTLAQIAARFGVSLPELMRLNQLTNPNLIAVGQRLLIPAATNTQVLPTGVTLAPQNVAQGETLTLAVAAPDATDMQGALDKQDLHFRRVGDTWYALAGISRCANYVGNFPVALTWRDAQGNAQPMQFDVHVNAGAFGVQDLTLTAQMSALLDPAIMNAENALVGETVGAFTAEQKWQGKFRLPLDVKNPRISTTFGERRSYNGGAPGLCGHEGTDYAVAGGTPVYAPAGGVVVLAEPLKVRGNVVFIDHGRGVFSAFYHLDKIIAKQGQRVQAGDLVAQVGTTGFSTGYHLHWSMWVNGVYVNPSQWMEHEIP
ncbi:LysM peptidoglycan-binding domain-containing protein [Anaerolineae bacterium CFX7]|nr:LysM peptidoglycan-binding domain-containing protein [Anaerolineae bacterium CFX7]